MKLKILTGIAAAIATVITATACASPQYDDLQNIPPSYPDYAAIYMNVSGFPNVTMICVRGIGFATTTRDYTSLMRIPEWDAFCVTKEKSSK